MQPFKLHLPSKCEAGIFVTEPDWNNVVREIGPALLRYFSASFPNPVSSDLVQEVLIRLVQKYRDGKFSEEKGTLRMFAFGIAHFVRLEGIKAFPPESYFANVTDYESRLHDSQERPDERVSKMRQAIAGLNEVERQIILLHIDEELTLAEISEILNLPIGTTKSHVHRAKEKLKLSIKLESRNG